MRPAMDSCRIPLSRIRTSKGSVGTRKQIAAEMATNRFARQTACGNDKSDLVWCKLAIQA